MMGFVTDLLKELPLSAVQRERFQLLETQFSARLAALESQVSSLQSKCELLEAESGNLQMERDQARSEVNLHAAEIERLKNEANKKHEQDVARANAMPADRVTVLRAVCNLPDQRAESIARIVGLDAHVTEWHLDELLAARLVSDSITVTTAWDKGGRDWIITSKGRAHLAALGLLGQG